MKARRIPTPARARVLASERHAYDSILARLAESGDPEPRPYLATMLQTPTLGSAINELGRLIRLSPERTATYTHEDHLLVVHALGVDAEFIDEHHIVDALALGVRAEALEALLHGREEELGEEERRIVDFARRVVRDAMTDEVWDAVRNLRGDRGAIDLSIVAGFVWMTMSWQRAWGVEGASPQQIEDMLRRHRDGTLELPDARTAIRAR
jgi:hypothetical protein